MTKPLPVFFSILLIGHISFAQNKSPDYPNQRFSADTVRHTINALSKELSLKHPGFYRYNSVTDFKIYIDSVNATIKDSLSELEVYRKLKPVISKIGCLHTGLSLPQEYKEYMNEKPNLFPCKLFFADHKAYLVKNYSTVKDISPGNEIVSINGQGMDKIIDQLFALIPSDGYNVTMKYRALNLQFPLWYRTIDLTEDFSIIVTQNNIEYKYQLKGQKYKDMSQDGFLTEPVWTKQLEFKIEKEFAVLTIHSFAKTIIKKTDQNFKNFIDEAFLELASKNIKNLIVDLRDNTGGSDPFAVYFTSYFFDRPFRFWDRIEVTEAIAKEIKGPAIRLFYYKPVQKDSSWLWQKGKHVDDFDFYEVQQPAKNNFKGKTYILINGFCMSSCADVSAILSYNKKALFIGQETGGCYQGNNSGMIPETKLEPFGFTLTVPLQKFYNYVDTSKNVGRGTMPDYPINTTVEDNLKRDDMEMAFAMALIRKGDSNK